MAFDCLTAFYARSWGDSNYSTLVGCHFCCFVALHFGTWLFCLFTSSIERSPKVTEKLVWSRISIFAGFDCLLPGPDSLVVLQGFCLFLKLSQVLLDLL